MTIVMNKQKTSSEIANGKIEFLKSFLLPKLENYRFKIESWTNSSLVCSTFHLYLYIFRKQSYFEMYLQMSLRKIKKSTKR